MTAADRAVNHNWNRPQETTVTDTQPDLTQALAVTKPGNGVARANPKAAIKAEVERYRGAIAKSLPGGYEGGADRFVRSVLNAIMTDKKGDLAKCTPLSIVGAALHAAQLGLEIGPLQEAYLVPRGGECTFMTGYKGLIKLAYIGGVDVEAQPVREFDEFDYVYGTDAYLRHKPARGDRGKVVEYWSMGKRIDGSGGKFVVVDQAYVDKRKAKGGPSWKDWPEEMALKTAVRALMRTTPLSARGENLTLAINSDGVARTEIDAQPADFADDSEIVDGEIVE